MLSRDDALAALADEPFDVLVIGGGITGAGVALDAASRGYSVGLVEKGDYARGTSSRSSKLVHGGLRYLQNFDLGLVREALLERQLMAALAPHLVRPLPLIVPAFDGARPDRLVGIGLNMYDVMAVDRIRRSPLGRRRPRDANLDGREDWSPARHRVIDGAEVSELIPALAARDPSGGYLFYDCQTDDVRLVLTVLAEAERFGAVPANRVEATALTDDGALVRDAESGAEFAVRAANVVNATGVWADRLRPNELRDEAEVPVIRPSRGTHIVLPAERLRVNAGVIAPAGGGRTIFVLPWLGQTLVGTTDNDYDGRHRARAPGRRGRRVPARRAERVLRGRTLGAGDVAGAFAGVRPLISTGDPKKSVDISRKAELYETSSGMITITGGKLTTWRRMAKLAVDRIVERDGRDAPCRTHEIPLGMAVDEAGLQRVEGVPEEAYAQLAGRYGHAARDVLALAAERGELAQPILAGRPDLLAEAVYAARGEQARSVGDVLLRRTRLGLTGARTLCAPGEQAPERVAAAIAGRAGLGRRPSARRGRRVPRGGQGRRRRRGRRMSAPARALRVRGARITLAGAPLLMGIVNASPDSFSDAGELPDVEARVARARELVAAGARIVDVGGESAFGGRPPVPADEEAARVVPVIERIARELDVLVSVDTYKPAVAEAAIAAGAQLVNDVSGLREPALADVCAATGAGLVLMHTRAEPKRTLLDPGFYDDVVVDVRDFLGERIAIAEYAGMHPEQLLLDPGPGLRQDAGADGRRAAPARPAPRARPPAAAGRLAQGLPRRDHRSRPARSRGRDAGRGRLGGGRRRARGPGARRARRGRLPRRARGAARRSRAGARRGPHAGSLPRGLDWLVHGVAGRCAQRGRNANQPTTRGAPHVFSTGPRRARAEPARRPAPDRQRARRRRLPPPAQGRPRRRDHRAPVGRRAAGGREAEDETPKPRRRSRAKAVADPDDGRPDRGRGRGCDRGRGRGGRRDRRGRAHAGAPRAPRRPRARPARGRRRRRP